MFKLYIQEREIYVNNDLCTKHCKFNKLTVIFRIDNRKNLRRKFQLQYGTVLM